jgi:hypothetical protein
MPTANKPMPLRRHIFLAVAVFLASAGLLWLLDRTGVLYKGIDRIFGWWLWQ